LRIAGRRPAFAAAVVLTLALGIGGNVAMFSLIDSVVLSPLPYADSGQLHSLMERHETGRTRVPSYPTFQDWSGAVDAFDGVAFARGAPLTYRTEDQTGLLLGAFVTEGFFEILGVGAHVGRTLQPEDYLAGVGATVVLSHGAWTNWFGADPAIIGATIALDDQPFVVVGVMPSSFSFPDWGADNDLWLPVSQIPPAELAILMQRGFHADSRTVARLTDDATLLEAQAQLDALASALAQAYPETNAGWTGAMIEPLADREVSNVRTRLLVLWAAVGFVLLLCCLNLANLYTVHGRSRSREYAIRAALGAGHARLVRQVITETSLLAALGGGLGVVIAARAIAWAREGGLTNLPRINELGLDAKALLLAGGLSVGTAVLFALIATRPSSMGSLQSTISRGQAGSYGLLPLLVQSVQVAITFVLLVGAGLLGVSFINLSRVDPGYDPQGLVVIPIQPPSPAYDDEAAAVDLYNRLLAAVERTPGVLQVALTNHGPSGTAGAPAPAMIGGAPEPDSPDAFEVVYRTVSDGFFAALGIPVVAGAEFAPDDLAGPVGPVVINQTLARRWGGASPLGQTLGVLKSASSRADFGEPLLGRVAGVVGDLDPSETGGIAQPTIYVPFTHTPWSQVRILARTASPTAGVRSAIQEAVWSIEPAIPLTGPWVSIQSVADTREAARYDERLNATLVGTFALVSLLLATVGMYGVISYTVSLQTRAIGVRMALGATRGAISGAIVGKVAFITTAGLVLGMATSLALAPFLSSLLFGVQPVEGLVYTVVATLLLTVALCAGYGPARRAGKLDPLTVLYAD
jgi:predicted permease